MIGDTQDLRWIHPDLTRQYFELRSGDEVVATLTWDPTGESAAAKANDRSWTLRRLGFLNPHVVALDGSGSQTFRFDATMSGGGMGHARDGHLYRWYSNLWRAEWGWMDSGENDLLKFRRSFDVEEKQEGFVELLETSRDNPNLELLILVGWYLIITAAETNR